MLGDKWMIVAAIVVVVVLALVVVTVAAPPGEKPGDPQNKSAKPDPIECNPATQPECNATHQYLLCRNVPGSRLGEWMCVGKDAVTPKNCQLLECEPGYECVMVFEPGAPPEPRCIQEIPTPV